MAPIPSECLFHKQAILDNSEIFLDGTTNVKVVDEVDESGTWHAHLLTTRSGMRSCVLSESGDNAQDALEKLHRTSARAVSVYKKDNGGFGFDPPAVTVVSAKSSLRGGVAGGRKKSSSPPSAIIALGDSSSGEDSDDSFVSDDSDDSHTNRRGRRQRGSPRRMAAEAVRGRSGGNSDKVEDHHDNGEEVDLSQCTCDLGSPQHLQPVPPFSLGIPPPPPPGPTNTALRPVPPPPGWTTFFAANPPMPPAAPNVRPYPPPGPPGPRQPPRPFSYPAPPQIFPVAPVQRVTTASLSPPPPPPPPQDNTVPVLLNINYIGRGRRNILVQAQPSEDMLKHTAIMEARLRPSSFVPTQGNLPPLPNPDRLSLRAAIRRVTVGGDAYELTGLKNDLTSLFRSAKEVLKFDIEVTSVMIPPPPPPPPAVVDVSSEDEEIS